MLEKQSKLIRLIWGIVTSLLLVALGICLIVSCITIYKSGSRPFSRESVAQAFSKIAVLVYITVGVVVVGLVGDLFLKKEERLQKGNIAPKVTLSRLYPRLDTAKAAPEALASIQKMKRLRLIAKSITVALCVACAAPVLIYFFTPGNFTMENLNGDIFAAIWFLCAFSAIAFVICVLYTLLESFSYSKEIALIKQEIANGALQKDASVAVSPKAPSVFPYLNIARIVIAVIAVLFIILGVLNGGMADVLAKAIRICTECIGLG